MNGLLILHALRFELEGIKCLELSTCDDPADSRDKDLSFISIPTNLVQLKVYRACAAQRKRSIKELLSTVLE